MSFFSLFYLIVVLYEGELSLLQELRLGDVQPIFTVQELDHRSITVPHRQIILHYQAFQMLYDTSAEEGRRIEGSINRKRGGGSTLVQIMDYLLHCSDISDSKIMN